MYRAPRCALEKKQQHPIDNRRDAETTLYALKRILNASDSQTIELADQQDFFQTPPFDLSDPLVTALAQRPELHALDERIKAAQLAHKEAVAGLCRNLLWMAFGMSRARRSIQPLPATSIEST